MENKAILEVKDGLQPCATEFKQDPQNDIGEALLYFELKISDGSGDSYLDTKNCAVAVNNGKVVEFDIRVAGVPLDEVEEAVNAVSGGSYIVTRIDEGEGPEYISHIRNWDCSLEPGVFTRFIRDFCSYLEE